jgi:hypothetical protein
MHAKVNISDLEKLDAYVSPRSGTGSVEGKKQMIYFSTCLSYVNIRDVSASLTKGRRVFLLRVSDYASKGRHTLLLRIAYYTNKGDTCC